MTARLGRYGVWQLRDYILGPGGATLVIGVLAASVLRGVQFTGQGGAVPNPLIWLVGMLCFFGPIFACSSLVSEDRSRGYYRLLFAKPVNAVLYYAQAFLLRGVALLAIVGVVWGACVLFRGAGPFVDTMLYAVLCYVMIGGVTFLLSAVGRHAWLGTLIAAAAAKMADGFSRYWTGLGPLWAVVRVVLPPFQLSGGLVSTTMTLWWVSYGVVAIALALIMIRRQEWPL